MRHVIDLVNEGKYTPEICTVDCGPYNVGDGNCASNAQLVERARTIIESMGASVVAPGRAREMLQLRQR